LQIAIADKIVNVFRPESLGRIVRRRQGRERCELAAQFSDKTLKIAFSLFRSYYGFGEKMLNRRLRSFTLI
jgi:hypothetical protein